MMFCGCLAQFVQVPLLQWAEQSSFQSVSDMTLSHNKKVLLRERKRHTARRVASTPYVVLTWVPPCQGTPPAGYPPILTWSGGYLTWVPPGRVPPHQGIPPGGPGRVPPPPGGCPMAFWEMLQSIMGYGYPPPCGQTNKVKVLPSRCTTYAGANDRMLHIPKWIINNEHESW